MYRVIKYFTDLQDNDYPYNVGDTFPRRGMDVTAERFAELASDANRQKKSLIEWVDEPEPDTEPIAEVIEDVPDEYSDEDEE